MSDIEYIIDNCSNQELSNALIKIVKGELQLTSEEEKTIKDIANRLV